MIYPSAACGDNFLGFQHPVCVANAHGVDTLGAANIRVLAVRPPTAADLESRRSDLVSLKWSMSHAPGRVNCSGKMRKAQARALQASGSLHWGKKSPTSIIQANPSQFLSGIQILGETRKIHRLGKLGKIKPVRAAN
jgi:hypothetical protein